MISILIPTFQYKTLALVKNLYRQATTERIVFEIIVQDDGSKNLEILNHNKKINKISNCKFLINTINIGRSENRNSLIRKAKYDWILFIDCDMKIYNEFYLKNFIDHMIGNKIIFGGIIYNTELPEKNYLLRWYYGKHRETQSVLKRNKNPYKSCLISNTLIPKSILLKTPFRKEITEYGYEDIMFILDIKKSGVFIKHIDNPTIHDYNEQSFEYLLKWKCSLNNLKMLLDKNILQHQDNAITYLYYWLNKVYLKNMFLFFFIKFQKKLEYNLLSSNPSLFLFDIYRLGYFCKISTKKEKKNSSTLLI